MVLEPDAELMLRVKAGDPSAFGELLDRHVAPVFHFIYRLIQNQQAAEKLAEEVFLRVFRARNDYRAEVEFRTWLFGMAMRIAREAMRDGHLCDACAAGWRQQGGPVDVRRAVQALPAEQRAAVLLHKYEGMSVSQIARVLGRSESAAGWLLLRGYETLGQQFHHQAASAAAAGALGPVSTFQAQPFSN